MSGAPHVYQAILDVMEGLAKDGIGKDRKNEQQGYKFRGIDDCYNAISRLLPKCKLALLPRYSGAVVAQRGETKSGTKVYAATMCCEVDLVSAVDGSKHTVTVYGEATDQSDKSSNKCMSAAFKYAILQTFCVPTEGDNDADASHVEVLNANAGAKAPKNEPAPKASNLDALAARIREAANMDQLLKVGALVEKETDETKAALRPVFKARKAEIEKQ